MAASPANATVPVHDELTRPASDVVEDGSATASQSHKGSALRNFFKHGSAKRNNVSPRKETAAAASASRPGNTHQASQSGEEDFEDHMRDSPYKRSDVCKACGFPRGSSVCCPVTRRHHGTDVLMSPAQPQHHSWPSSGAKNLMAKIRGKLPLGSGGRRSNQAASDEGSDHTPQNSELPVLSLADDGAEAGDHDGTKQTPLVRNHTLCPQSLQNREVEESAQLDAYASGDSPLEEEAAPPQEAQGEGEGEGEGEAVQYYCYTDENGDTYYYTQELRESMHDATQAPQQPSHTAGGTEDDGGAAAAEQLPSGAYIYQYVDENGETVNCLCTPQADGDGNADTPAAGEEGEGVPPDDTTAATSAMAHAGSDTANSSETGDSGTRKNKSPAGFFSSIHSALKGRRGSRTQGAHEDPNSNMAASSTSGTTPGDAALSGTASGLDGTLTGTMRAGGERNVHDAAVVAFAEQLDADERKRFVKERKRLVKDLLSSEKKEREAVMKARQDGMSAFSRDRLAGAFSIRKDERTIKHGQKRSEPL